LEQSGSECEADHLYPSRADSWANVVFNLYVPSTHPLSNDAQTQG